MSPDETQPRNFRDLFVFVRAVALRFDEDRCFQVAGSLTFTALLALVPLLLVALSVISAFPMFSQWSGRLEQFMLENLLPQAIGDVVVGYFQQFAEKAGELTAVGILMLVATALITMLTIDHEFNHIFRVRRHRPIVQQLLIYWAALTLGPVLFGASLTMTSFLISASLGFTSALPIVGEVVLRLVPILLTVLALTLLYLIVPHRRVRTRHALIGGSIAGLAFEVTKRGFALYVAQFPTYELVYGTFAAIPMFLLWLYLSWAVVLLGAVITSLLPGYRHADTRRRAPGVRFLQALDVLGRLHAAQQQGSPVTLARLAADARLAPESCERLLERMDELDWVVRASGDGWVLARDPQELLVADVYRGFVFVPELPEEWRAQLNLAPLLDAQRGLLGGCLNLSLKEYFRQNESHSVVHAA